MVSVQSDLEEVDVELCHVAQDYHNVTGPGVPSSVWAPIFLQVGHNFQKRGLGYLVKTLVRIPSIRAPTDMITLYLRTRGPCQRYHLLANATRSARQARTLSTGSPGKQAPLPSYVPQVRGAHVSTLPAKAVL